MLSELYQIRFCLYYKLNYSDIILLFASIFFLRAEKVSFGERTKRCLHIIFIN